MSMLVTQLCHADNDQVHDAFRNDYDCRFGYCGDNGVFSLLALLHTRVLVGRGNIKPVYSRLLWVRTQSKIGRFFPQSVRFRRKESNVTN